MMGQDKQAGMPTPKCPYCHAVLRPEPAKLSGGGALNRVLFTCPKGCGTFAGFGLLQQRIQRPGE